MREQKKYLGLAARLLSGAKDFVWQDDQPRQSSTAATAAAALPPASPQPQQPATAALTGMAADLMAVVMNRPTAYSALADAVSALSSVPMDEATRFASAFAVLQKTQQRTVEQIVQAIDVHLGMLESEKSRFNAQSTQAETSEVESRLKEADELAQSCADADERIARLRAETEAQVQKIEDDKRAMQERAAALLRDADERRRAIASRVSDFTASTRSVEAALLADKAKLQRYLGASTNNMRNDHA